MTTDNKPPAGPSEPQLVVYEQNTCTTCHGYDGGRESVALYQRLFKNLRMGVDEQITEGGRVPSRWALHGTDHGLPVALRGIAISRFGDDGRIVEDHGHSDSISLLRRLGPFHTLRLALEVLTGRVKLPKDALRSSQPR